MMIKTCEADAYDAIPKRLSRVNIVVAIEELRDAGYILIADAGVMCVVERDGIELQLFSSGRVLVKTESEKTAKREAARLFESMPGALII